jgi:hypothetical protein
MSVNALARSDLNSLLTDTASLLARAVQLGIDRSLLPTHFGDTFTAFLRTCSLMYAQQHRTGIALGRSGMRQGLLQTFTCVELGLEEQAGEDVEAAIEVLRQEPLTALRARGYEIAFGRIEMMRDESRLLRGSKAVQLCPDLGEPLTQWARAVPETWSTAPPGAVGLPREPGSRLDPRLDPRLDFTRFLQIRARVNFVRSLPPSIHDDAVAAHGSLDYDVVLRRAIVAIVRAADTLALGVSEIEEVRLCHFAQGRLAGAKQDDLNRQLLDHLNSVIETEQDIDTIRRDVTEQISQLAAAADDTMAFRLAVIGVVGFDQTIDSAIQEGAHPPTTARRSDRGLP